jgi:hypothetical protein
MLATAKSFLGADLVLDSDQNLDPGYSGLVSLYRASKSA